MCQQERLHIALFSLLICNILLSPRLQLLMHPRLRAAKAEAGTQVVWVGHEASILSEGDAEADND